MEKLALPRSPQNRSYDIITTVRVLSGKNGIWIPGKRAAKQWCTAWDYKAFGSSQTLRVLSYSVCHQSLLQIALDRILILALPHNTSTVFPRQKGEKQGKDEFLCDGSPAKLQMNLNNLEFISENTSQETGMPHFVFTNMKLAGFSPSPTSTHCEQGAGVKHPSHASQ